MVLPLKLLAADGGKGYKPRVREGFLSIGTHTGMGPDSPGAGPRRARPVRGSCLHLRNQQPQTPGFPQEKHWKPLFPRALTSLSGGLVTQSASIWKESSGSPKNREDLGRTFGLGHFGGLGVTAWPRGLGGMRQRGQQEAALMSVWGWHQRPVWEQVHYGSHSKGSVFVDGAEREADREEGCTEDAGAPPPPLCLPIILRRLCALSPGEC